MQPGEPFGGPSFGQPIIRPAAHVRRVEQGEESIRPMRANCNRPAR